MKKDTTFDIYPFFSRWQDGQLDETEYQTLHNWLNASAENREQWEELRTIWRVSTPPETPQGSTQLQQWQRLFAKLSKTHSKTQPVWQAASQIKRQRPHTFHFLPRLGFAALALVILALVFKYSGTSLVDERKTITVPFGQRNQLQLADGSVVEINAGSSLIYPEKFAGTVRQVELSGEAYFHIAKNKKSFHVLTNHADVEVVGTAFNIRAWGEKTVVSVETGEVSVRALKLSPAEKISFYPGEIAVCDNTGRITKGTTDTNTVAAWRKGWLVFHRTNLKEALDDLHRRYGIAVQADSALLHHAVTATFRTEPLSDVLQALAASLNAKVKKHGDRYVLQAK